MLRDARDSAPDWRNIWRLYLDRERLLLHQVQIRKLAADVGAEVVSLPLIWRGHRRIGLTVHFLVPVAASAWLLPGDVEPLRQTPRGRYVLSHMPAAAQGMRLLGDLVMTAGAWRRDWRLVIGGAAVVAAGWSHGLIAPR